MKYLNSATKAQLNSIKGKYSKIAGETFENMIIAACEYYKMQDIAYIEKTPEAFRITGKKSTTHGLVFEGVFTRKSQPDFKGTLHGGQAICFEAKHTDGDSIAQNRLTGEQMNSLELHHKLGAKAYILVSLRMQHYYMVPWTTWQNMKSLYGRKYMKEDNLKQYEIKFEYGILKFLDNPQE
jgi:recombination protein U